MMHNKINLKFTGIAVAALLLAACSSNGGASSDPPATAGPEGCEKEVTLTLLRPENSDATADAIIKEWEAENECVKIQPESVPWSQLFDRITVTASGQSAPDIFVYDSPQTKTLASQGVLLPLDTYISDEFRADLTDASVKEYTVDGKMYTAGLNQDVLVMYYNKSLLEEAGIPEPPQALEDAWTWDEAISAFQSCQKGSVPSPDVWGLAPSHIGDGAPGFMYRDLPFARSAGDPKADKDSSLFKTYAAISPDGKSVDGYLNTPEAIAALKKFQSLYQGDTAVTPTAGIPNAFIDGKACFEIQGPVQYETMKDTADLGFEFGTTPMPYIKTPIVHTGSVTLGVSSKTEYPDLAAKFAVDLSKGKFAEDRAKANNGIPQLKSLMKLPMFSEYPQSMFVQSVDQWGAPRPQTGAFLQYDDEVTSALRDIALGSDVESRMQQAVEKLEPILKKRG